MSYAEGTSVPIDRSQNELRRIISKYGASSFAFGEQEDHHVVMFEMEGRRMKFILPMPVEGRAKDQRGYQLSAKSIGQECRRRWRCLVLAVKAKLECVDSGITSLETEFMANILLPNGRTVGQMMTPQIESAYKSGKMPPMLGCDG